MGAQGTAFDVLDGRGKLLGWEAIGRVDLGRTGYCTGTLIATDLVLTAAHCVFDGTRAINPETMRFRAGFNHGDSIAVRGVRRVAAAPGYTPTDGQSLSPKNIANDVALLQLDQPIYSAEADPFALHEAPPPGTAVSVVSYGRGRDQALSRQAQCNLMQRYRNGIVSFDCDVTFGSSGAPVFARDGGRLRILSVISAISSSASGKQALGMDLGHHVATLRAQLRAEDARPKVSAGIKRIGVGDRAGSRAKFVRP